MSRRTCLTIALLALASLSASRVLSQGNVSASQEQTSTELSKMKGQAENGDPIAEFTLGYLYEQGKGVPQDYRQAVEFYRAAAQQGHATAENNLASMYLHGRGVAKSLREAINWYRASAEHGDPA